ncbi:MAG: dihydrodipicolinate reductase [Pseudomonadota bacterium]
MLRFLAVVAALAVATPAFAYERISDRATFMSTVGGKDLRIALYGLTINVLDNGSITGKAVGWDLTGSWSWEDGYFCRDMDWSGYPIDYNCQLVEVDGDRIRFTVDRGAGDNAVLRIR